MSLRNFLLLPLVISLGFFVYFSPEVKSSLLTIMSTLHVTYGLIIILVLACCFQVIGHIVRAYKARILLEPIKNSSTRFQFRALSIGYLFDTVLPFRLGELLRARIISDAMTISFSFALVLIILERALDALILGVAGLFIIPLLLGVNHAELLSYSFSLVLVSIVVFGLVILALSENRYILTSWLKITEAFNDNLKNGLRFKAWSVIYGLHRVLKPQTIAYYLVLSAFAWIFYIASTLTLVQYFFPALLTNSKIVFTAAPYYGAAIPSGPANLGVFSRVLNAFTGFSMLSYAQALTFNLVSWAVLVVPIAGLGLVLLVVKTKESLWQRRPQQASKNSLINKLYRTEDISYEMSGFLENYFAGNNLTKMVHRLEIQDNFHLLKYFKGGSDAITVLVMQDEIELVKKIIPLEFEDRLKAQYDWLYKRRNCKGIVEVLGEQKTKDCYAIDLKYRPEDVMFFDFIHSNPLDTSKDIMEQVWIYLFKYVYRQVGRLSVHEEQRDAYVQKHIIECLEKAAAVDKELLYAVEPEKIMINGKRYDNLYQILAKIKNHKQAWRDIASYSESEEVHGDVAIDNILVSGETGMALLIDPAPDGNVINGPVFDFGKNMQSLYCGYEFLLRDDDPVKYINGSINYRNHSSAQYNLLCDYVRNDLAKKYLSDPEQKSILFHAAALHIRRLKHQVYYNPSNVLKFYGVGVKTLNDFLDQYEQPAPRYKRKKSKRNSYKLER